MVQAVHGPAELIEAQGHHFLRPGPAAGGRALRQAVRQQGRLAKLEKRLARLQDPKAPPPLATK